MRFVPHQEPPANSSCPVAAERNGAICINAVLTTNREFFHIQLAPLRAQAQKAYEATVNSPRPDWRAIAEFCRAAMQAEQVKRAAKSKATPTLELAHYDVDRYIFSGT